MTPLTLGIDPGRSGALVLLRGRELVAARAADGPEGYHRHSPRADPDPASMHAALVALLEEGRPELAVIEAPAWYAGSGGRMSAGVAGRMGIEAGIWRALLVAHGIPYEVLSAAAWRKRAGIVAQAGGDPKAATIAHIGRLLPGLDLFPARKRIPHDGLADAAGMALAAGR